MINRRLTIDLGVIGLGFLPPFRVPMTNSGPVNTTPVFGVGDTSWQGPHTDPNYRGLAGRNDPPSKRKRRRDLARAKARKGSENNAKQE